jgi:hypothetical protein
MRRISYEWGYNLKKIEKYIKYDILVKNLTIKKITI